MPELPLIRGRRYGYKKNPPDPRDLGVARFLFRKALPPRASNAQYMGPVLDQGQQGSCTAHAGVADREFLHWKQIAALGQPVTPGTAGLFSPAFLYYMERSLDGTLAQGDCGSTGRTSCQALRMYGCATRSEMPYTDSDCSTAPTQQQLEDATQWPTGQYHFAAILDDLKSIIASGYNFRWDFVVQESFEDVGPAGLYVPSGDVAGEHETLAYEFDDTLNGGCFTVRNSWSAGWGKSGDFYIRYSDFMNTGIFLDACIQHLGKWS